MRQQQTLRSDARALLTLAGILTLCGLLFIYSASSVYSIEKYGIAHYYLKKQFLYLLPSLAGFFFFSLISFSWLQRFAPLLFFLSLGVTSLTFLSSGGVQVHGSSRWLSFAGFGFQPSELLKLFLFMYLGVFFARKKQVLHSLVYSYIPFLFILGFTSLMLLMQPDFGAAVTVCLTAFLLFFVAEYKTIHLLGTLALSLPIVTYLILAKSYRLRRILIFLNPWDDPHGKGFQIIQSLIAIGGGGLWGKGIAHSQQKFFYLPMQHTDFIFSIIAEEVGFFACSFLILLYVLFCYRGLRIVSQLRNPFAFFTCLGFMVLLTLQAVINLSVVTGLVPTKGLGLPFISFGGSALLVSFCMLGFIINCVRNELA